MPVTFITGIDTDSGKTMATGLVARYLYKNKRSVITQKIAQTGCENVSEDIITHRKIMGVDLTEEDKKGLTCPYLFKYPASPHLAAKLENKIIDTDVIANATDTLSQKYEIVLLEGAGGLYVPLNDELTILDYIEIHDYPIIIVSSSKLGSINHTLLSLDAVKNRDLDVRGIIYNHFPEQDKILFKDTREVFEKYLNRFWLNASIIDIPIFDLNNIPDIDFNSLFYNKL